MRRVGFVGVLSLILLSPVLTQCSQQAEAPVPTDEPALESEVASNDPEQVRTGTPTVTMTTKRGDIVIELRPDLAPQTVERFLKLAESGFYYNSLFHRVMPGRMIQGGDPNSKDNNPYNDGQGNSESFLTAEFSREKFARGTVAMARQAHDPNSASCQFFICLERVSQWDGEYTVFGRVVEGIEVTERISNTPRSKDPRLKQRPATAMWIKKVKVEYRSGTR